MTTVRSELWSPDTTTATLSDKLVSMAFTIPSIDTLKKLLKSSLTVEAQEKIMALREAALKLQQENLSLRQRIAELESLDG